MGFYKFLTDVISMQSKILFKIWILSMILFINLSAMANDADSGQWDGSAKLGFIFSKTSTSSLSVNSGATLTYEQEKWKQNGEFATYYTNAEDNEDGANKYKFNYGVEYFVANKQFIYFSSEYEHDRFATYRHQLTTALGFGATLIDTEQMTLSVGVGPGYRFSQRQNFDPEFPKQEMDEVVGNSFIDFNSGSTNGFKYGVKMNIDFGEANSSTNVKAYVKNQLVEDVSLLIDIEYIYNTVTASNKNSDEIYSTISLNYDF